MVGPFVGLLFPLFLLEAAFFRLVECPLFVERTPVVGLAFEDLFLLFSFARRYILPSPLVVVLVALLVGIDLLLATVLGVEELLLELELKFLVLLFDLLHLRSEGHQLFFNSLLQTMNLHIETVGETDEIGEQRHCFLETKHYTQNMTFLESPN